MDRNDLARFFIRRKQIRVRVLRWRYFTFIKITCFDRINGRLTLWRLISIVPNVGNLIMSLYKLFFVLCFVFLFRFQQIKESISKIFKIANVTRLCVMRSYYSKVIFVSIHNTEYSNNHKKPKESYFFTNKTKKNTTAISWLSLSLQGNWWYLYWKSYLHNGTFLNYAVLRQLLLIFVITGNFLFWLDSFFCSFNANVYY